MDNLKNLLFIALVLGVLVGGGLWVSNSIKAPAQLVKVGAVSSPDIASPYISFGGVRQWASKTTSLNNASTTLCALQSPVATSTLRSATFQVTTGTTTAVLVDMARSPGSAGTTTLLNASIVTVSGTQYTLNASTSQVIFSPNDYFVVKYGGALGTSNVFQGSCTAVWQETQ